MFGECGVFMLLYMEQLVSGRSIGILTTPVIAAMQFRTRMDMIYYGSSRKAILN